MFIYMMLICHKPEPFQMSKLPTRDLKFNFISARHICGQVLAYFCQDLSLLKQNDEDDKPLHADIGSTGIIFAYKLLQVQHNQEICFHIHVTFYHQATPPTQKLTQQLLERFYFNSLIPSFCYPSPVNKFFRTTSFFSLYTQAFSLHTASITTISSSILHPAFLSSFCYCERSSWQTAERTNSEEKQTPRKRNHALIDQFFKLFTKMLHQQLF